MSSFQIPHVLRSRRDETGIFPNAGFDIVYCGIVVVNRTHMRVYEWEEWEASMSTATPVLVVPYASVSDVDCDVFRSAGGNYRGGQVRIVGIFDEHGEQLVTMQMSLKLYHQFVRALQLHMNIRRRVNDKE